MQVLYLGRALRTKETLPDFLKWRRVTRHPLVFRGLTGSQRTPEFGASHLLSLPDLSPLSLLALSSLSFTHPYPFSFFFFCFLLPTLFKQFNILLHIFKSTK